MWGNEILALGNDILTWGNDSLAKPFPIDTKKPAEERAKVGVQQLGTKLLRGIVFYPSEFLVSHHAQDTTP